MLPQPQPPQPPLAPPALASLTLALLAPLRGRDWAAAGRRRWSGRGRGRARRCGKARRAEALRSGWASAPAPVMKRVRSALPPPPQRLPHPQAAMPQAMAGVAGAPRRGHQLEEGYLGGRAKPLSKVTAQPSVAPLPPARPAEDCLYWPCRAWLAQVAGTLALVSGH